VLPVELIVVSRHIHLAGTTGSVAVAPILAFSIGETPASPRSKEYGGRIASREMVGMDTEHFHRSVALDNPFGGLFPGVACQHFGPHGINRPGVTWVLFAVPAVTTSVGLVVYNRFVVSSSVQGERG
jgi:hypothetical protein